MTTVTWLGGPGEPDELVWNGVTFPQGEAVDVSDAFIIRKAKSNQHFVVDGVGDDKPTKADHLALARAAKAAKRHQNI